MIVYVYIIYYYIIILFLYNFTVLSCSNMFRIVLICFDIFMQHSFEAYPKNVCESSSIHVYCMREVWLLNSKGSSNGYPSTCFGCFWYLWFHCFGMIFAEQHFFVHMACWQKKPACPQSEGPEQLEEWAVQTGQGLVKLVRLLIKSYQIAFSCKRRIATMDCT